MVLDWGLNLGRPALEASALPLDYQTPGYILTKTLTQNFTHTLQMRY